MVEAIPAWMPAMLDDELLIAHDRQSSHLGTQEKVTVLRDLEIRVPADTTYAVGSCHEEVQHCVHDW